MRRVRAVEANPAEFGTRVSSRVSASLQQQLRASREDGEALKELVLSARSTKPVSGSTHTFYRYPARFAPRFARAAIEAFSEPGDVIIDPFFGGGTVVVESLMAGRKFLGCDVNRLAAFVSRVKTTPLSDTDVEALRAWGKSPLDFYRSHRTSLDAHSELRHVPWWLRRVFAGSIASLSILRTTRQRDFARCSLLRTGQRALDCRAELPTVGAFLNAHHKDLQSMLFSAQEFSSKFKLIHGPRIDTVRRVRKLLTRSAIGLDQDRRIPKAFRRARLVITSPPYPGVHVLYHRWQVLGRRETPLPFFLAGTQDGRTSAYYTFGDRHRRSSDFYMSRLCESFRSIANLLRDDGLVVMLVAFSEIKSQLSHFLRAMYVAGFQEISFENLSGARIWRRVPNRKWYACLNGSTSASKEVVLFFKKR